MSQTSGTGRSKLPVVRKLDFSKTSAEKAPQPQLQPRASASSSAAPTPLQQRQTSAQPPSSPRASPPAEVPLLQCTLLPEPARRQELRAYLDRVKVAEFRLTLFRNPKTDVPGWRAAFFAALLPAMQLSRSLLLGNLPELVKKLELVNPEEPEKSDSQPFIDAGKFLAYSLLAPPFCMPPVAIGMLAEVMQEIKNTKKFTDMDVSPREQGRLLDEVMRQILVQTGFLSFLLADLTGKAAMAAMRATLYVKVAFGMEATSQGSIASMVKAVDKDDIAWAAAMLERTCAQVRRAVDAEPVEIHWKSADLKARPDEDAWHDAVLLEVFRKEWPDRDNDYVTQLRFGAYQLWQDDGTLKRCSDFDSFAAYIKRNADSQDNVLPEVMLHFAGARLKRYINTYLLGGARREALGLAPKAVFRPEASVVIRHSDGHITLNWHGVDSNLKNGRKKAVKHAHKSARSSDDVGADEAASTRLEVRVKARFKPPEHFRVYDAFIYKTDY